MLSSVASIGVTSAGLAEVTCIPTQTGTLDVTPWLEWFLGCLDRAFDATEATLAAVRRKARFWEHAARPVINDHQRFMLNRLLDGFTGQAHDAEVGGAGKVLP